MLWGSIRSTVKKISETKSEILRKLRRTTETFQKPEIGTLTLGLLFRFLMSNSQLQTSFLEGLCPSSLLWTCSKVWRSFLNTDCSGNHHYTTTSCKPLQSPPPLGEPWGAQSGRQECCLNRNLFPWLPWALQPAEHSASRALPAPGPGSPWMEQTQAPGRRWKRLRAGNECPTWMCWAWKPGVKSFWQNLIQPNFQRAEERSSLGSENAEQVLPQI